MIMKAFGLVVLVLGPTVVAYSAGYTDVSQYFALGAVLAINLTLLARPIAPFAALLPMAYAAAAVTSESTDGVAALIVAVAAAVGAASSQGLHRGLLSVLAAALIGSFEPAEGLTVFERAGTMLAGCVYGVMLGITLLRKVEVESRAVHPQTALSYAVLLAVLVLIAWLVARVGEFRAWLVAAARSGGDRRARARRAARARGRAARTRAACDVAARRADPVLRRPHSARAAGRGTAAPDAHRGPPDRCASSAAPDTRSGAARPAPEPREHGGRLPEIPLSSPARSCSLRRCSASGCSGPCGRTRAASRPSGRSYLSISSSRPTRSSACSSSIARMPSSMRFVVVSLSPT